MIKLTMKDCGFENHEVGDSGIFHAIAEALTVARMDKSWDNIISVGVDDETNEGIVKYKDSILPDESEHKDVILGAIHLFSYFASEILIRCYMENITTIEDYVEYALGTFNHWSYGEEADDSRNNAILSVIIPLAEYLPFIYACTEKLAYSEGRTLLGKTLKKIFDDMGFSLESEGKSED